MNMKRSLIFLFVLLAACATSETEKFKSSVPATDAEKSIAHGDDALVKGNLKEAKRRYELGIVLAQRMDDLENATSGYIKLAEVCLAERDNASAAKYIESAKMISDKEKFSKFEMEIVIVEAALLSATDKADKAVEILQLQAAKKISPENSERLYNAMGRAMLAKNNLEEAKKYFELVISKTKNSAMESAVRANLAQTLLKMGKHDAALIHLNRSLELDKKMQSIISIGDTLYLIGTAYEAKKDAGNAEYFYKRALTAHAQVDIPEKAKADRDAILRLKGPNK
jgi:tetratricopeptide (TPR) repeat protein